MEFLLFHPVANRGSNGRVTAVVNQLATSMYAAVVDARRRDLSCINQTRFVRKLWRALRSKSLARRSFF